MIPHSSDSNNLNSRSVCLLIVKSGLKRGGIDTPTLFYFPKQVGTMAHLKTV